MILLLYKGAKSKKNIYIFKNTYNFKYIIGTDEVTSLIVGQWKEEAKPLLKGLQNHEQ